MSIRRIKQSTYTIYNIYDVGGELTVTTLRKKAIAAFKKGKHIIELHVTDSRASAKVLVSTTIAREW
jgi:hypothetical protein